MSLELATIAIESAMAATENVTSPMNIAIVDSGAHLVSFARMDSAWLGSVDIAIRKAKTAVLFSQGGSPGLSSGQIGGLSQPGGTLYGIERSNGGLITFPGGIPIFNEHGKLIGAIGVSGDTVKNDEMIAKAGKQSIEKF